MTGSILVEKIRLSNTPSDLITFKDKKDSGDPNEEFFTFVRLQRSTNSKLISTNKDMFTIWGQNGVIATFMAGFYLLVWAFGPTVI